MIQYPAFRSWQAMQKRTNNSLVALVIGTRLAEMKMSEAKGFGKVGQVLAGVAYAERLDVSADAAELIFQTASTDIAFLAIPQVVALHIELCVETVEECLRHPGLVTPSSNGAPPDRWMVPELAKAVRFGESPTTADHLMKFCVALRNTIMHGGGKVDRKLITTWKNLDKPAKKRWSDLAGRPFTYSAAGALPSLSWMEVLATLAITKQSAHEINERVTRSLTRQQWAELIARDYRDSSKHSRRRFNDSRPEVPGSDSDSAARGRDERIQQRLRAHADTYYRALAMTTAELRQGRALATK